MKLRTLSQLQDHLDREYSWRLKEISDIKLTIKSAISVHQKTLIRAGVPLLYAHWEGFVKSAAEGYINFVSYRRLRLNDLSSNFVALAAKKHLSSLTNSSSGRLNISAVDYFRSEMSSRADISSSSSINTKSNLSSSVFEGIAITIGINHSRYSTKYNLIDSSLVGQRNSIAHGEYLELDNDSYSILSDEIIDLLRWVKDDIENCAYTGEYQI